jgi:hypothetical protein
MPSTNAYGFTYPLAADQVDVPADMLTLANTVGPYSNMRFASAAARDALLTAPIEGMKAWLSDIDATTVYMNGAWQNDVGQYVSAPNPMLKIGNRYLAWGSSAIVTNASGDSNVGSAIWTACGWAQQIDTFQVNNGDGTARANVTLAVMNTFPAVGGSVNVRAWVASTGAVVASQAVRYNWLAIGY